MAKGHKPKAGSRGYWKKKRAKRIYPGVKTKITDGAVGPLFFAVYKAGMSRAKIVDTRKESTTSGEEIIMPVTIFDCSAITVCAIKAYKLTPYGRKSSKMAWMDKPSKDLDRKSSMPKKIDSKKQLEEIEKSLNDYEDIVLVAHTNPRNTGLGKKKPELFEIPLTGKEVAEKFAYAKKRLGTELKIGDVFAEGEYVDAIAITKGKGFQGAVKRFGIKIRPRKHEKKRRNVGNIGAVGPGRVLPGVIAMPGQLGFQRRTENNKMIIKIGDDAKDVNPKGGFVNYGLVKGDYTIIAGSVPGPKKRLVMLRKAIRAYRKGSLPEFKKLILDSSQ